MSGIIELINALLAIIKRAMAKQEQRQHEATVDEIQSNPGAFMSDHFNSVPDSTIDHAADKASPRRTGTD